MYEGALHPLKAQRQGFGVYLVIRIQEGDGSPVGYTTPVYIFVGTSVMIPLLWLSDIRPVCKEKSRALQ